MQLSRIRNEYKKKNLEWEFLELLTLLSCSQFCCRIFFLSGPSIFSSPSSERNRKEVRGQGRVKLETRDRKKGTCHIFVISFVGSWGLCLSSSCSWCFVSQCCPCPPTRHVIRLLLVLYCIVFVLLLLLDHHHGSLHLVLSLLLLDHLSREHFFVLLTWQWSSFLFFHFCYFLRVFFSRVLSSLLSSDLTRLLLLVPCSSIEWSIPISVWKNVNKKGDPLTTCSRMTMKGFIPFVFPETRTPITITMLSNERI